uniref:Uncharacterized protein n=1 Tax=Arundo donax TaxID=35708 RepID=A0A0A9E9J6_ARUDO
MAWCCGALCSGTASASEGARWRAVCQNGVRRRRRRRAVQQNGDRDEPQ